MISFYVFASNTIKDVVAFAFFEDYLYGKFLCIFLAMIMVPCIFQLVTLPLCPESPKYILITQGRDVAAQKGI